MIEDGSWTSSTNVTHVCIRLRPSIGLWRLACRGEFAIEDEERDRPARSITCVQCLAEVTRDTEGQWHAVMD